MLTNQIENFLKDLPHKIEDDPVIIRRLFEFHLAAPTSFWDGYEDIEAIDSFRLIVNGCGPGGVGDRLVPDTVWGLNIKPACMIHDWCFTVFNCEKGFDLSNQLFLDNMLRINKAHTEYSWLRWLRSRRILKYYAAVHALGRLFYYDAHLHIYERAEVYNEKFTV